MISSMTAFGAARAESSLGTITVELRTVNSRYLDIHLRLPDELRVVETSLREQISRGLSRGKVDVRLSFVRANTDLDQALPEPYLQLVARQLQRARTYLPDTPAPGLSELIKGAGSSEDAADPKQWVTLCGQATSEALAQLQASRGREGARLAEMMRECAHGIELIINDVEQRVPQLLEEHQNKLAGKLRETLEAANPAGFAQISGEELSARIAQETSLFSLRIDIAEELSRLRSHLGELKHLLGDSDANKSADQGATQSSAAPGSQAGRKSTGSVGKRLDFLFQEMNREANTLGSKASGIEVTRAAIDLKLLIEQLREQAQNIE